MRKFYNKAQKMMNLENLAYLTVAGLPLYLVKVSFFGFLSNVLEILEALVLFIWLLDKKYPKPRASELMKTHKKYLFSIGLIIFGLIISTWLNGNYRVGLGIIKGWFVLPALFTGAVLSIFDRDKALNIFKVFFASALAVSLAALGCFFSGQLTYDGRLTGPFNSPNYLAMYLSPALITGLMLARSQRVKVKNKNYNFGKLYYAGCVIIMASLYLTYSYAAWSAVIISLIIAETITNRRNILKSKVFWGGIFLTVLLFFSQWNSGKLQDAYTFAERSSLSSRLMIWKTGGKLAKDNLLWGIGPGNFQAKYLEYQKFYPPYLEWAVPHPHNLYLAFLLQAGLPGLAGFILFLFFWLADVWRMERSALRTIVLATMFYILIHGLVDTTYFKNDLAIIFWLNFLILSQKKLASKTPVTSHG
ncbi:MAG: hypothetical protein CO141_01705 [Candidatus Moranbacteria bacterium CG_4_9_14_3_um_filter_42_9]|nr:MAG: hypothetical protein CO141_01705 [Candidatus Moranbacteria bacterium CG_4_9_14_3_um_filter_42_9]